MSQNERLHLIIYLIGGNDSKSRQERRKEKETDQTENTNREGKPDKPDSIEPGQFIPLLVP